MTISALAQSIAADGMSDHTAADAVLSNGEAAARSGWAESIDARRHHAATSPALRARIERRHPVV